MTARGSIVSLLVLGACVVGAGTVLWRRTARPAEAAGPPSVDEDAEAADEPPADWCAPGFEPIRGGACFAAAGATAEAPLVVYLHGRYARDAASEEIDRQKRLAARATALGFAVVAVRGRLGTCTAPELANWYCWPSNETNADAGLEFVAAWGQALATAQERAHSHRRFLLGFSNGGYFASLVASRGWLEADAIVIAHGGPVEPVHPRGATPPRLLLSADDDVAQDEMIRFDEELTHEGWAHDAYARAGGHALTDGDIDAALTFFSRAREPLPLQPPLPLHRAVRHVREAGAEDSSPTDDTQIDGGEGEVARVDQTEEASAPELDAAGLPPADNLDAEGGSIP